MRSCVNHATVNTKYCFCATNVKLFIIIIISIVAVVHGHPHSPCFSVACCSTGVCVTHHRREEQLLWQRCGFYKDHCTNNEVNQKHKAESVGGEEEWGDTDICVPRIDIRATFNDTTQRQETGPMSEHRSGGDASPHGGSAEDIFESQTDAHAASTASLSECSLHLNGGRSPRAALLHDPCILMYIIIHLHTYGSDPGTIRLMEPRCQPGDQSVRLKNITGFTCWLWSVVVNLMAWKWVTVMCERVLQYHS